MPTMGSLFDGIGGFPLAAIHNGITPLWASEIEPFPIEVTRLRFPDMIHVGDITKLNGADLPPVDIITGGSPCQDLSVAGTRAGLAGARSGLFMEQIRIVKEMRDADERRGRTAHTVRPRYMCWENVPGAFSSGTPKGEDFRIVLEEIVRVKDRTCSVPRPDSGTWESAGAIILGDQFSLAWRVLDAQYWGVAQRRKECSLSQILQADPPRKYYLSRTACLGILRRADARGKELPFQLKQALQIQAGVMTASQEISDLKAYHINQRDEGIDLHGVSGALMATTNMQMQTFVTGGPVVAFAANQRDEVRDLHGVAAALGAQPGMKQQTFVAGITAKGNGDCFLSPERHTSLSGGGGQAGQGYPCILTAGFSAGAGSSAGSIGYGEEVAPTLKGSASGNCMPSILCLNDQGGSAMGCSEDVAGTLRAQEHGHQPLVFENHGIDARYTGPHKVAPTMSARYGTGGNNVPLVAQRDDTFCITGNAIDRQPLNGGNGIGYQQGIAYTLTATDHHAVFSRQRVDVFKNDDVASTQSARQHKDATDLVVDLDEAQDDSILENETLVLLIRRLTPLECERLQGFPDGWTDIEGASDSARYKALGNSVAIPCVDYVLRGIAWAITAQTA